MPKNADFAIKYKKLHEITDHKITDESYIIIFADCVFPQGDLSTLCKNVTCKVAIKVKLEKSLNSKIKKTARNI